MIKELPVHRELVHLREEILLERSSKYSVMTKVLRLMPLGLQLGYYFGRWVDDVVDGDEAIPADFESVDAWLDQLTPVNDRKIYESPAAYMLQGAVNLLEPLENKELGDNVRHEFGEFIEAMRWEYHRQTLGLTLSETEINYSYWEGFSHAQNITLIALKSKTRVPATYPPLHRLLEMEPNDLPLVLPLILGKAYAIKDLEIDLAKGIFNIPRPVIKQSGLTPDNLMMNPASAQTNPAIRDWADQELSVSRQLTVKLRHKKLDLPTRGVVEFLTAGIAGNRL